MTIGTLLKLAENHHDHQNKHRVELSRLSVLVRAERSELESYIYEPVLCLILQGSKETACGNQKAHLRTGDALLVSHHLPVLSRITEATADEPYVALILDIDLELIRSLYSDIGNEPMPTGTPQSLAAGPLLADWIDPFSRYLGTANHPLDAKVLGLSLLREIHYRLIISPLGAMLRQLMVLDSHASRIARATHLLKAAFRSPLKIAELAREAGMSATSFHQHFKAVTGTTPLQYQKNLRLTEGRHLLLNGNKKVAEAAYAVGYESPAQFSREFRRRFGYAPRELGITVTRYSLP